MKPSMLSGAKPNAVIGGLLVAVVVFISALVTGLQSNTIRRTLGAQDEPQAISVAWAPRQTRTVPVEPIVFTLPVSERLNVR